MPSEGNMSLTCPSLVAKWTGQPAPRVPIITRVASMQAENVDFALAASRENTHQGLLGYWFLGVRSEEREMALDANLKLDIFKDRPSSESQVGTLKKAY